MVTLFPGENRVCLASAVRFIQLLFHYEQHSVFTPLARHMLQALQVSSAHRHAHTHPHTQDTHTHTLTNAKKL